MIDCNPRGILAHAVLLLAAALCATNVVAQDVAAATAAQENAPFDVLEFRVLGNTTLPSLDVEKAVYPYLGPGKRIAHSTRSSDPSLTQTFFAH